jgi:hypothetical protein
LKILKINSIKYFEKIVPKACKCGSCYPICTLNANWFVIKKVEKKFDKKFVVRLRAHPLLYRGVNLGYGTKTQREQKQG